MALPITDLQDRCDKLGSQAYELMKLDPLPQDKCNEAEAMLEERTNLEARIATMKEAEAVHNALQAPAEPTVIATYNKAGMAPQDRRRALMATDEYKDAFFNFLGNGQPMPQEFLNIITTDGGSGTQDGSALIPTEFEAALQVKRELANPFRGICTVTSSPNDRTVPIRTTDPTAAWIAENASITPNTDYALTSKTLSPNKCGVIVQATSEALADARVDLEADLINSIGRAIGNLEEAAICVDGGATSMEELVGNVGTVVTAAANSALDYDALVDMQHGAQIEAAYEDEASWVMSHFMIGECRKVKDDNNLPIWIPGFGGRPDTMFNRPLVRSKGMPTALSAALQGAIFYGAFREYRIHDRPGMTTLKRLNELYAANDAIGWLATARVDGAILQATAFSELALPA